ncbi:sugar phosphate isomerase/epimerase family protein [Sphingobacterium sp. HJSM2_6]|uniref:sugar phosphate isomerase/epimerase family protein n=1 Tax=Sphingobacterium sp. HJSM2_6 TaxID=3366264 RepID=UPI003BCC5A0B
MLRKDFLKAITVLTGAGIASPAFSHIRPSNLFAPKIKKALSYYMIKEELSLVDKFKLVKDLGFDGVEMNGPVEFTVKEILEAKAKSGIEIPSLVNKDHWGKPLSDPDPSIRKFCIDSIVKTVQETKELGGDTVLVVPGVVNEKVSYETAWKNSIASIRQIIPQVEKTGVKIGLENVWNNFILSPIEAKKFLAEINHPLVGWYFDIGNILRYGWPEHWLETLNSKIVKLHVKEFSRKKMNDEGLWKGFNVELTEGDIDWKLVMETVRKINYKGEWMTLEVGGGDRTELQKLSGQLDKILLS